MSILRAGVKAGSAADTFFAVVHYFRATSFGFRIVTPQAGERTALQKNGRAYSRTVVDAKFLNVENTTLLTDTSLVFYIIIRLPLQFVKCEINCSVFATQ